MSSALDGLFEGFSRGPRPEGRGMNLALDGRFEVNRGGRGRRSVR
jgi:hypothetical protein